MSPSVTFAVIILAAASLAAIAVREALRWHLPASPLSSRRPGLAVPPVLVVTRAGRAPWPPATGPRAAAWTAGIVTGLAVAASTTLALWLAGELAVAGNALAIAGGAAVLAGAGYAAGRTSTAGPAARPGTPQAGWDPGASWLEDTAGWDVDLSAWERELGGPGRRLPPPEPGGDGTAPGPEPAGT